LIGDGEEKGEDNGTTQRTQDGRGSGIAGCGEGTARAQTLKVTLKVATIKLTDRRCAPEAKAAVSAHERNMHRGKRPTFRARGRRQGRR
jgi:heat shock protein HslJ